MLASEIHFCPRCGSELTEAVRYGRLRKACPQCDWVYFADPKVAAGVLVDKEGQVLLVRRSVDPARAAERECLEETGLQVQVTGLIDVLYGQEHERGAHIIIFYRAEIQTGSVHPGDDVDQAVFFPPGQLPPLAFTTTRRILDYHFRQKP